MSAPDALSHDWHDLDHWRAELRRKLPPELPDCPALRALRFAVLEVEERDSP